jgi:membrane-associated protease RseP (regulator of RpoE activity)
MSGDHETIAAASPSRRSRSPITALVIVAILIGGYFVIWRAVLPNQWNTVNRVLNMDTVGWVGIGFDGVSLEEQAALGVPSAVKLTHIGAGSPAEKAGLLPGDYVVKANGATFSDVLELQGNAKDYRPGQTITLTVVRGGSPLEIPVTLAPYSESKNWGIPLGL